MTYPDFPKAFKGNAWYSDNQTWNRWNYNSVGGKLVRKTYPKE